MNILWIIDRISWKIKRWYRNKLFCSLIESIPKGEKPLIGDVVLANRNVRMGSNVHIYPGVWFWGDGEITIGNNVDIGTGTMLYASSRGGITIGDNTQIAAQGYIIDMDHGIVADIPVRKQKNEVKPIWIGTDVWVGANVTILKGSVIGDGAVIGAKALVKGEIKRNEVVAGNPARYIKERTK